MFSELAYKLKDSNDRNVKQSKRAVVKVDRYSRMILAVKVLTAMIVGMAFLLTTLQPVSAVTASEEEKALMDKLLGQAIVDAARARTAEQKAQTQEALGQVIVTAALIDPQRTSIDNTAELGVVSGLGGLGNETQGERVFYVFASLGAVLFSMILFVLSQRESADHKTGALPNRDEYHLGMIDRRLGNDRRRMDVPLPKPVYAEKVKVS